MSHSGSWSLNANDTAELRAAAAKLEELNTAPAPIFRYFPGSGRAIGCRIALFAAFGKEGWLDERMTWSELSVEREGYAEKLAKNDPADLPKINHALGALPVLEINGHVYSQSVPIARWAALTAKKKPNQPQSVKILYPETDLLAQLLCDELMATASEVHDRMPFGGENLLEKRAEFKEGFMKKAFQIFEQKLENKKFFLSDQGPSLADFFVLTLTELTLTDLTGVPAEYLDQFPRLKSHHDEVVNSKIYQDYCEANNGKKP